MGVHPRARFCLTVAPTPLAEPAAGSAEHAFADVQAATAEHERGPRYAYADLRFPERTLVVEPASPPG